MKNLVRQLLLPLPVLFFAMVAGAFAQNYNVDVPQPGAVTNGIDPATLNVAITIPIFSRAGIGSDFGASITFNNNFWMVNCSGYNTWCTSPSNYYGWTDIKPFGVWLHPTHWTHTGCGTLARIYSGYRDPAGFVHEFINGPLVVSPDATDNCYYVHSNYFDVPLNDGSGLHLHLGYPAITYNKVVTSSGKTIIPYNRAGNGEAIIYGSSTDADGNQSSTDITGVYTDTLGTTALTYTGTWDHGFCNGVTGSTYTYPTSSGNATVTVNCSQKTIQTNFGCSGITDAGPYSAYLVDNIVLGDGTSTYSFTYESQVASTVTGRLASITYPNGKVVSYSYPGANQGTYCTDHNYSQGTPLGLSVADASGTTTYTRVVSPTSGIVTTTAVSPSANNNTVYTFSSGALGVVFPTQTLIKQGSSSTLKTLVYCYNGTGTPSTCPTAAAPSSIGVSQVDAYSLLTGMSGYARTTTKYDSYGNLTETDVYDFGASSPTTKTVVTAFGYTWNGSTTSPNCTALIGNGIMDKPCQVQLLTGSGTQLKNSYFQYSATGHVIHTGVLEGGNYVTSSTTYNTNGSINVITDANGQPTTITEGACNSGFPTVVTPAITSLAVQTTWDAGCLGAKPVSVLDSNGFSVSSAYSDPFWRVTSVGKPSVEFAGTVYTNITHNSPNEVETILNFNSGNATSDIYTKTFPTTFNNVETQTLEGPSSGNWDTSDSSLAWDSTGIVSQSWMPCVSTTKGGGCTSAINTTTHDALGRPLIKTDGGGGYTTYQYIMGTNKYDVLATLNPAPTGEVTKKVQKEYNGLGQLLSVCKLSSASGAVNCNQAGGGTGFLTTFTYNVDGTLASAVRGSQTHSFTYDNTGRVLASTTPEGGQKQFFYDSAPSAPGVACSTLPLPTGNLNISPIGHLVKTYDANGTTACYSYDQMGRNTGIAYSGANSDGLNRYFFYDAATVHSVVMANAKGRIAEAYTAATVAGTKVTDEGFSYTALGQISDVYQWSTHSGGWYHTTATYFDNGALRTLAGITGGTWTFGVDGKGRPNTALQGAANEVTGATFNAANQPLTITLGLGDKDTYTYDDTTGRMASFDFAIKATPVHFTGTPNWNRNGTLRGLTVVDGVNTGAPDSEVCSYGDATHPGYDEIGRLLKVDCWKGSTAVWGQDFTYGGAYDNLSKTVPTGQTGTTWTPSYDTTNNRYSSATYDPNGNLLTDTFHTYTWNQDNHLKGITDAGLTMTYDAFGRMVEKYNGTTYQQELISPIGPVALMTGQTATQFRIPLPGGAIALNGINFEHKDWLGSASFISNRNRTPTATRLFSPYGEIYNNTGIAGDVDFTGDRQDLVAGLYDTPNRELNPSGRWISPDPAGASWNAYAYSTNPLVQIDPSGLNSKDYAYMEGNDDWEGWGFDWFADFWFPSLRGRDDWRRTDRFVAGDEVNFSASLPPVVAEAIAAAISGNWRALLDSTLGAVSQGLWNQVNQQGNCDPICFSEKPDPLRSCDKATPGENCYLGPTMSPMEKKMWADLRKCVAKKTIYDAIKGATGAALIFKSLAKTLEGAEGGAVGGFLFSYLECGLEVTK